MQKIQLYIEGQRLDTFTDESVTITQSIKNVKDIDKVFTDFTKTFSLPASKTNNKIFKHYYNFDIQNGFDARIRKPANIELNNTPFTEGLIKLEGVDLKDNKPHTYKITFFGNTVTLNDIIGDDTLASLDSLVSLNETYDSTSVKAKLEADPTNTDIIVPLITHSERLIYNSHSSANIDGNIHFQNGNVHGVLYSELKYAIRIHRIIQAIEDKYPAISFSDDFFVNTNAPYYNLFMWLHRKKGDVENLGDTNQTIMSGWDAPYVEDTLTQTNLKSATTLEIDGEMERYTTNTELVFSTASTDPYSISLQKNGIEVLNFTNVTGNLIIDQLQGKGDYTIYIESDTNITFSNIQWFFEYDRFGDGSQLATKTYNTSTYDYTSEFTFDITQQIPTIKIIDFISGLFKTFNLVAYVEKNENKITVKTLDSFYSVGGSYDISKYVDVSKSSVNIALPYKEIGFEHEDTKTKLASIHAQKFGKVWGKENYTNDEKLDGSIYNIKTPFSQLKYERLIDINNGNTTAIQWGYFVDDNDESYFGKPLIFYPIRQTQGESISFLTSSTNNVEVTDYNIPSNSVALSSATSSYNINFYQENNEYATLNSPSDTGFTNTLFQAYYSNYITSVFNPTNRITKVTAYLPLRILRNYTLADRFVINGKSYKINSIKTNLKNGKSDLELLNDL
tara:strand:+ start:178 stop:2208 length:2031 start_codon:yes stop_codon:yes gene_type:complete